MPRAAVGIPDRDVYGDPMAGLTPGQLMDWIVQHHQAERAGPHYDVRLGSPEMGLYSWAARKGLPTPGQKHLAVQQPLHEHAYGGFEGRIPSGYGAGLVKKHDVGQVLVTKVDDNAVHFTTAHRRFPERFTLVKPKKGKNWLLINTTPTQPIPYQKVPYANVPEEKAEEVIDKLQPESSVQAKIDGAASLTKLHKDHFEVVSYRTAKATGYPLVHTERIAHGRPQVQIPPELAGTVLRGEIYGTGPGGRSIPPQTLGGLLNAAVAKSIKEQKEKGIRLKNMVFDVHQIGKEQAGHLPYKDRMAKLKEILTHLPPETFHGPEEAKEPEAAKQMLERIRHGEHPLTREGVVIHSPQGKPQKLKFRGEHDVYIRDIFPGMGKYEGTHAGGFRYSHHPEGPIVGEVGTGLSDAFRRDLWENQGDYLGRVAKVHAQEKLPSGALRAPSFHSLHEDYPQADVAHPAAQKIVQQTVGELGSARERIRTMRRPAEDPTSHVGNALSSLRQAKLESDRKNWGAKHDLVRKAVHAEPHHFTIDSQEGGIAGLTHKPTGFKIHVPLVSVPDVLRQG